MTSRALSALLAGLLAVSLFAGGAAAVETSSDAPAESEVGADFQATYEVTDLFSDATEWTLRGETNLTNVTWTVTVYDQADTQLRQETYTDATFEEEIDTDGGTNRVEVEVVGTTPAIENYTYDPPETFTAAAFTEVRPGGTEHEIDSDEVHHYTTESKEARQAIDDARDAVERSGSSEGQQSLESAISAYENGNFENAIRNAERAEEEASESQFVRNAALAAAGVVVLLLVAGGGYYAYRSREDAPSRLK